MIEILADLPVVGARLAIELEELRILLYSGVSMSYILMPTLSTATVAGVGRRLGSR